MSEFSVQEEFPAMQAWIRYFSKKKSIISGSSKENILFECCADGIPKYLLHSQDHAVIITNQRPKEIKNTTAKFFFLPEKSWYGGYYNKNHNIYIDTPITKKYNCFMNRLEVHRQSFFYELYVNGLLDQGHVSMLCEIRENRSADPVQAWKELHDRFNS